MELDRDAGREAFRSATWVSAGFTLTVDGEFYESLSLIRLFVKDSESGAIEIPECPAKFVQLNLINDRPPPMHHRDPIQLNLGSAVEKLTVTPGSGWREAKIALTGDAHIEDLVVDNGDVQVASLRTVSFSPAPFEKCLVRGAHLGLFDSSVTVPIVVLRDADFSADVTTVQDFTISGDCRIATSAPIERLSVDVKASLSRRAKSTTALRVDPDRIGVESIGPRGASLAVGRDVELRAALVTDARISVDRGGKVVVLQSAKDSILIGPGEVLFERRASGQGLTFRGSDPADPGTTPLLRLSDSVVLVEATGAVRLGDCRNAQLEGGQELGVPGRNVGDMGLVKGEDLPA